MITVRCVGSFGTGSKGNPSTQLVAESVKNWMDQHPDDFVAGIILDLREVEYEWGDGPISSLIPLLSLSVGSLGILASDENRAALQNLVAASKVPYLFVR